MTLSAGARVGQYEILAPIGSGGTGEVFLAHDTKLERRVALKFLPHATSERFIEEARAASALDHPNIVTVFDVGEAGGQHFIAMQYVEGETLRARMGNLTLAEALDFAIQIASGLAAAHARNIIHRDLKPENVLISSDGEAKIVDFGLAKLTGPTVEAEVSTVTKAQDESENAGFVGTAPYVSPEQATGGATDARSDIFSFGAVLYEMLSGRRAFTGDSIAETLPSVLRDEPERIRKVPPELERIVRRALRKNPDQRFQSMADLKVALLEIREELATLARRSPLRTWIGASAVAALIAWLLLQEPPAPRVLEARPVTSSEGLELEPALSPDGTRVAYTWNDSGDGVRRLYVKILENDSTIRLTDGPGSAYRPAWSPDGTQVAFIQHAAGENDDVVDEDLVDEIRIVPAIGGTPRLVATAVPGTKHGLSWSPDDRHLAYVDRSSANSLDRVFLLALESGDKTPLTNPPSNSQGDAQPVFSPDGSTVAFLRFDMGGASNVHIQGMRTGDSRRITFDTFFTTGFAWTSNGDTLLYSNRADGSLFRRSVTGGNTERVATTHRVAELNIAGDRIVFSTRLQVRNVWRGPGPAASVGPIERAIVSTYDDWAPAYSPDGNRIAFVSNRSGSSEIWVAERDGTNAVQVTHVGPTRVAAAPAWAPNGTRLAAILVEMEIGYSGVGVVEIESQFLRTVIDPRDEMTVGVPSWSPDGERLYFHGLRPGEEYGVWRVPVHGGEPERLTLTGRRPLETENGRVLFHRGRTIWSLDADGHEDEILDGNASAWTLWKDQIVYAVIGSSIRFESLSIRTGATATIGEVTFRRGEQAGAIAYARGISVAPDGSSILFAVQESSSDLMVADGVR